MSAEYAAMLANLTATQERCNELLEEKRQLARELTNARTVNALLAREYTDLKATLEKMVEALHAATAPDPDNN
jgi:hypothetical protein